MIKKFNHHKGVITNLKIFIKPTNIITNNSGSGGNMGNVINNVKPIQQFKKSKVVDKEEEFVNTVLCDIRKVNRIIYLTRENWLSIN